MVSTVSIAPAMYIQVAGGLNLAVLKKFSVAGSVNLPTMCGMKNSPQIRRRTLTPSVRSKFCAQPDMMPPLPFVDAIVLLRSFPRVSRPAFASRLQGERRRKLRSVGAAIPRSPDEQSEIRHQRPGLPIIPSFRCGPAGSRPPLENLEHL